MKRRDFLDSLAVGIGSAFLGSTADLWAREPDKRPNILFIFADDQSHEALGMFASEVETPNLDKLAARGATFTNAYNQGSWTPAVCAASRTMLNTGRFLWNSKNFYKHGAIPWREYHEGEEQSLLWSQYFHRAGYDTYMSGKWHVKTPAEKIFDRTGHVRGGMPRQSKAGYSRPKGPEDYKNGWKPWEKEYGGFWQGGTHWSEVLANEGVQFLEEAQNEKKPFFMYLAFNAPHDPRQSPRKYVDKYPLNNIDLPENFLPEYPFNSKIGCGRGLRDEKLAPFPRTDYSVKVNRQEYYAIISHMDDQVGRILQALEASGQSENTYIIFTADHGLACGHHGLMGKQNMFEHSMKSPLILTGPGIPAGEIIGTPVYLQDIMPTSLQMAGIEIPDSVDFKSLLPLIRGKQERQYKAIYGAYLNVQRMVRKDDYKLIYYPKIDKTLLFNLKNDPKEMRNLADDPKYSRKLSELMQTLRELQSEMGDKLEIG